MQNTSRMVQLLPSLHLSPYSPHYLSTYRITPRAFTDVRPQMLYSSLTCLQAFARVCHKATPSTPWREIGRVAARSQLAVLLLPIPPPAVLLQTPHPAQDVRHRTRQSLVQFRLLPHQLAQTVARTRQRVTRTKGWPFETAPGSPSVSPIWALQVR